MFMNVITVTLLFIVNTVNKGTSLILKPLVCYPKLTNFSLIIFFNFLSFPYIFLVTLLFCIHK